MRRSIIFVTIAALTVGMAGCSLFGPRTTEIRTWNDLDAIRNNLSGHYILMNDLDSTTAGYQELASPTANDGKGWHPIIGAGGNPPFTGTFDGQGYQIRDIFINLPGIGYVGLFSIVGEGGVVQNIGVANINATCTAYIGGLAGLNLGTVSNSYSTGSITSHYGAGGLVGGNAGTVNDSYSTCSVTGDGGVGGLVGANNGTVSNSYAVGSATGGENVGGLVGDNADTIGNSYSTGSVTGDLMVGGLVGRNTGTVGNSFWDTLTSGQATSAGGTGKTTAEMMNTATFTGADWNIVAVSSPSEFNSAYAWNIVTGQTYPFLYWEFA